MRFCIFVLTISIFSVGMPAAYADNISGTYVANYSNAAILLQIVETQGNSLTGRMEEVFLSPNKNRITISNSGISGAVGSGTVILKIKPAAFIGAPIPASGKFNGNELQISGGGGGVDSFAFTFIRESQSDFMQRVKMLYAIAKQIRQRLLVAAAIKKQASIDARNLHRTLHTAIILNKDSKQATTISSELERLDSKLYKITDTMHALLRKESAIYGADYGPARAEIASSIYGDGDNMQSAADDIQGLKDDIYYTVHDTNIHDDIKHAQLYCAAQMSSPACIKYVNADHHYQQHALTVKLAINRTMQIEKDTFSNRKLIENKAVYLENNE